MRAAIIVGLGAAWAVAAVPAHAALVPAAQLLAMCEKGETGSPDAKGVCLGFIAGVHDDLTAMEELGAIEMVFCPPATVTLDELRATVVAFLRRNKAENQTPASKLVVNALVERFPCKARK